MNALVLGSGAREHAIGWALHGAGARLCFAPGNAGTSALGTNLPAVDPLDGAAVARAATEEKVDLVVIGPEEPLARGVADELRAAGVPVFGPSRDAARLETSKAFSKEFMRRHGVPTASCELFRDFDSFRRHLERARGPFVLKKSGLAAGKGVLVSDDRSEMLGFGKLALESDTLLVEERLQGFELSLFVLMDGHRGLVLPACADHKKARDGDRGPNTGGMGAVCPVPAASPELVRRIMSEAVEPTMRGLHEEGLAYRGVLFLGLMVTPAGCRVLEYNVRFGDPEAQVLLPALSLDWAEILAGAAAGRFTVDSLPAPAGACVGVVVASPGYPDAYPKGLAVSIDPSPNDETLLFHASTTRDARGEVRTGGGRCFTVVGMGADLTQARQKAYGALGSVRFQGAWWRSDIGARHLSA